MRPRVLAFAGSTRRESFNKKLVLRAATGARAAGAEVTVLDLATLPLPLFDEDLERESGLPANALELKRLMSEHHGFLISCPEYNSSITAVLKNAIDWASRKAEPAEKPLSAFRGKAAALMSASPGALGGLRGLVHVRAILGNLGVIVLPDQRAVSRAHESLAEDGSLVDAKLDEAIQGLGSTLVEVLTRLSTSP